MLYYQPRFAAVATVLLATALTLLFNAMEVIPQNDESFLFSYSLTALFFAIVLYTFLYFYFEKQPLFIIKKLITGRGLLSFIIPAVDDDTAAAVRATRAQKKATYGILYKPIRTLEKWIQQCEGANALSSLSSSNSLTPINNYRIPEKDLAKEVITELFTVDRTSRLKPMLDYINRKESANLIREDVNYYDDYYPSVVESLSTLVMTCLGIPLDIDRRSDSDLQFSWKLIERALSCSTDFFVYDFILYCLSGTRVIDDALKLHQDAAATMNQQSTSEHSKETAFIEQQNTDYILIYQKFLKNPFMVKISTTTAQNDNKFKSGLIKMKKNFYRWVTEQGYHEGNVLSLQEDIQLALFEDYAGKILARIKSLQNQIWPFGAIDYSQQTSDYDYEGSSNNSSDENSPPKSLFYPKNNQQPQQPESIPSPTTNNNAEEEDRAFDNTEWIHVENPPSLNGEYPELAFGSEIANFEDLIEENRTRLQGLLEEFNDLLYNNRTIRIFNNIHKLFTMGLLTSPRIQDRLYQLQTSYKFMIQNFQTFHQYLTYYEKGFILHKIAQFIEVYKNKIIRIKMTPPSYIEQPLSREKEAEWRSYLTEAATLIVYLEKTYRKYTSLDSAYRYSQHRHRIMDLHHDIFAEIDVYIEYKVVAAQKQQMMEI